MMDLITSNLDLLVALIMAGTFAGFIAGLFGVGGGVVIVPVLYSVFGATGVDDDVRMKTAIATSLATIAITSIRSGFAHYKRGSVDVRILKSWGPWVVTGALIGAALAARISGDLLVILFGGFAIMIALQFAFGRHDWRIAERMPEGGLKILLANMIGITSALAGIGAGSVGVTLMTLFGKPIRRAVGTAAGLGAAVGIPGALAFMVAGLLAGGTVPFSIGYINLPAFLAITSLTVFFAPIGAKFSHVLPAPILRKLFAVLLFVTGVLMLVDAL